MVLKTKNKPLGFIAVADTLKEGVKEVIKGLENLKFLRNNFDGRRFGKRYGWGRRGCR